MKKKGFVKLYNSFSDYGSKYYLTPNELYTYAYLRMVQTNSKDAMVNIVFLSDVMDSCFYKNKTKHKQVVRECFEGLIKKNVINVSEEDYSDKDVLIINFNDEDLGRGHEQFKCSEIRRYKNSYQLYIHFVVSKYKNTERKVFDCSYDEWKILLNVNSKNTAIKYIDSCVDEGLIYRNSGDYTSDQIRSGQKKQKKNRYSIYPFNNKKDSNEGVRTEDYSLETEVESDTNNSDDDFEERYNNSSWKQNGFLDDEEMYLYAINTDEKKKKYMDKRLEGLKNKNKSKYDELMSIANTYKDRFMKENIDKMLEKNIDSVMVVDNEVIFVKDWDGKGKVEKCYSKVNRYEDFQFDGIYEDDKVINEPTLEQIELYRPINGEWRYDRDVIGRDVEYDEKLLLPEGID